ncbi:MAG: tetratricopeptide repeat protein [Cystobacterineae bacterium]|nr:tetratricopeptide repeat protein [Cystobacterineae bacterium]
MIGQDASDEVAFLEAFYRGGEWLAQGDFLAARLHLEQALRLNPNNEKTQNLLGLTYFKLNLWKDAAQVYEALVHNNPGDATLHINLGLVFLKQNNTSHAVRAFETAISLQQDNKKAHNYLGLALAQGAEYVRAREHFLLAGSEAMALRMTHIVDELLKNPAPKPLEKNAPEQSQGPLEKTLPAPAENPSSSTEVGKVLEELNKNMTEKPPSHAKEVSSMPAPPLSEPALSENAAAQNTPPENPPQEKEDVFPLPSAQRDSKPAERFQPPPIEEAPSVGFKISQTVPVLPWPQEGAELFQIDKEAVTISIQGELLTRLTGLLAVAGNLDITPEMRRYRGRSTDSPFGVGQDQMQRLMGAGVLFVEKATTEFLALSLGEGSLYLREENLFAFDERLNFENGRLSGEEGWSIDMVHLRGEGRLLLRLKGMLRRVPVPAAMSLRVPVSQLVGWYGQLTPVLSAVVGRSTIVLSGTGFALVSVAGQRP